MRRPYCYPVLADDGTPVTDDQTLTGGDHPHHRSLWVGQGDVNGVDHWGTNDATPGGPHQLPRGRPVIAGNRLVHVLEWGCGPGCTLTEERTMVFGEASDGARTIDLTSVFRNPEPKPIVLGDTKEAGLCAVRLSSAISSSPVITNANGQTGEEQCWGKPAEWCDMSGTIRGKTYGVVILSHPENPRWPMRWHVRRYGLLAANPFGLSAFDGAPAGSGSITIGPRDNVTFRHLIVVHQGNAREARIDRIFNEYAGTAGATMSPMDASDPEHLNSYWRVPAANHWWSVAGGILTGRQDSEARGSVLESKLNYRDVIVDLEYRYAGDVDSGVFLRAGQRWQCQIGISRSLQRDMTGSIYDAQRKYVAEAKDAPMLNAPGVWHRLRIEARGDRFRHWLDGRLVLDYSDPAFTGSGPIGLQLHGGVKDMQIDFRDIRILDIAAATAP